METVSGTFDSRESAERVVRSVHSLGIPNDRIAVLTPGLSKTQNEKGLPVTDTESPGEGKALGGVVGGVIGMAGGVSLGAAAASLIIPGVGPVIAGGLLGAAILGAGGAGAGMAVGEALDQSLLEGIPHDELFVYEHEVRQGRSVVITFVGDVEAAERVRTIYEDASAIGIDEARDRWWSEMRGTEEANYNSIGGDFRRDEKTYRRGFQAALYPKLRGSQYEDALPKLREQFGETCNEDAFRTGYERGLEYHRGKTSS